MRKTNLNVNHLHPIILEDLKRCFGVGGFTIDSEGYVFVVDEDGEKKAKLFKDNELLYFPDTMLNIVNGMGIPHEKRGHSLFVKALPQRSNQALEFNTFGYTLGVEIDGMREVLPLYIIRSKR